MNTVVQMPAPTAELVEQHRAARLAYTRMYGWIVVEATEHSIAVDVRRARRRYISASEVLAWADLPPVPETAA